LLKAFQVAMKGIVMFFRLREITQDCLELFIAVTSAACLGHAHCAISAHRGKNKVLRIFV
jgi:hypothetical protein